MYSKGLIAVSFLTDEDDDDYKQIMKMQKKCETKYPKKEDAAKKVDKV